jgi:hypothetical protein
MSRSRADVDLIATRLDVDRERLARILIAFGVIGLVISGSLLAMGGALAQETPANATATDSASGAEESDRFTDTLDNQLRVGTYEYFSEEEMMRIELIHTQPEGEVSRITATEIVNEGDSGRFGVATARILPGETVEIEIDVRDRAASDPGVMIVSQRSIERGSGVFVFADQGSSLFDGPATWDLVRISGFGALLGAIATLLGTAWFVISNTNTDYEVRL